MYAQPEIPRGLFHYINGNGAFPKELMDSSFNFPFPFPQPPTTSQGPLSQQQLQTRVEVVHEQASTSSQSLPANQMTCQQSSSNSNNNNARSAQTQSSQQQQQQAQQMQVSPLMNFDFHPNDFGHVIKSGAENLANADRYRLLTDFFTPPNPPQHEWPSEVRSFKGKTVVRRLNPSTLSRPDCATMAYSPMYGGLFCRYCAAFPPSKPQISKALFIRKPFIRFSHMFGNGGAVKKHVSRKYHKEACTQAEQFIQRWKEENNLIGSSPTKAPTNPNVLLGQMISNNINAISGNADVVPPNAGGSGRGHGKRQQQQQQHHHHQQQ